MSKLVLAGTAHRPKFCPCGYKNNHPWLDQLRADLSSYLSNYKNAIVRSGGAIGWDSC